MGTCISTGQALTVHQGDHFDATHIPLTCTAAPVYDAQGQLKAVLDISALTSPQPKASQHLALQLVKVYAHHVENASFLHRFRHDWVLRLSAAPQFLDMNPEYLLAVDATGRVVGHNRRAQLLLRSRRARPGARPAVRAAFQRVVRRARPFRAGSPLGPARDHAGRQCAAAVHARHRPRPRAGRHRRGQASERKVPAPLAALSGGDPLLDRQIERAARLVNSPVSMLLTGETGTGKEYFAKALHESSERRSRPFVAVNCAAIPETLIESELFGHLPGSFSGAGSKGKRGLIQEADGGTLFLDEIGDMPRDLQPRLLRVLAEREVLPIGATRPVAVNIRVIAATHCDLEALVREGRFRDDLYYRLNGARISLPPLRERRDLDWMIDRMLRQGFTGEPPAAGAGSARLDCAPTAGRATCASCATCSSTLARCAATATSGWATCRTNWAPRQPRARRARTTPRQGPKRMLLMQYLRAAQLECHRSGPPARRFAHDAVPAHEALWHCVAQSSGRRATPIVLAVEGESSARLSHLHPVTPVSA